MRLAALADIHGNLPALEAALADVESQEVDDVVVAGDIVHGMAWPQEVIDRLRAIGALMIRGNNEDYLVAYHRGTAPEGWRTAAQWSALRWTYRHLDEESLDFIAALPSQRRIALDGADPIRVVHGSSRSASEHLVPERNPEAMRRLREALVHTSAETVPLAEHLAGIREPVLLCGHSHVTWQQREGDHLAVNVGSVGAANMGHPAAFYALLTWADDGWQVEHRTVHYDVSVVRPACRERGLLREGGAFARACLVDIESGYNVAGAFVTYAFRLTEGGEMTDTIWNQAESTFDWEAAARGHLGV